MKESPLWVTLRKLGAVKRGDFFILDGFDGEFYLRFDVSTDTDDPKPHACDILIAKVGESGYGIRLVRDAKEMGVLRLLFALGISRFSDSTRIAAYEMNGVIRAMEAVT